MLTTQLSHFYCSQRLYAPERYFLCIFRRKKCRCARVGLHGCSGESSQVTQKRLCRGSHPFFIRLLPGGVEPSEVRPGAGGAEAALALPRTRRSSMLRSPVWPKQAFAGRDAPFRLSCTQPIITAMIAVSDATTPKAIVRISLIPSAEKDDEEVVSVICDRTVGVGSRVIVRLLVVGMIILA